MKKQRFNTTDDSENTKNDLAIVSHVEDWMSSKTPHHLTSKKPFTDSKTPPSSTALPTTNLPTKNFTFQNSEFSLTKTHNTRAPTINTSMLNTITQHSPHTPPTRPKPEVNPKTLTRFTKKGIVSNFESQNGKFNQEILEGLIKRRIFKTVNNGNGVAKWDNSTVKMVGTEFSENFKNLKGNVNLNIGELYRKLESDLKNQVLMGGGGGSGGGVWGDCEVGSGERSSLGKNRH
jgi:hypothetical protein